MRSPSASDRIDRRTPSAYAPCGRVASAEVSPSRRRRGSLRGLAAVEVLLVVIVLGVLTALALESYREHVDSSQSAEAQAVIQLIRGAQESYKTSNGQYLDVSTSINTYYPNQTPNNTRSSWLNPAHPDAPSWSNLNVAPPTSVRFGYACVTGVGGNLTQPSDFNPPPVWPGPLAAGTPWYTIQARAQRRPDLAPAVFAANSTSAQLFSQNETN
jgi:type II secretory pathway pseudopilin PulG